jgi:CelD/BcsL family acetyltransferase involved in cellulose biosynthesis
VATLLTPHFEASRLKVEIAPSSVCPYVVLPDSPDSYLASLGPKVRKHLKYNLRALQRLGAVDFETVECGAEIGEAFDELLRLHCARFLARGSSSAFSDQRVEPFHRAVLQSLSDAGSARIHLLKLRGEAIAAVYVLTAGTRTFFYQSGMNPDYGRYSVGSLLIRFAIEDAIRNQCTEFDFLRGDESYKSQWANSVRQMQCVRVFDDRVKSKIARTRQRVRSSLRTCKVAATSAEIPAKVGAMLRNLFPSRVPAADTPKQERTSL